MAAVRAGPRGQLVPIQQPVTRANGTADGCRRIGGRTVTLAGGVRMAGRVSLLTGSGFLGARSLIIPSRTGAARQAGGVIRSSGGPVRAPSTCQCGSVGCKRLAVGIGIYCEPVLADFCPDLECLGPGSSMQ